jgi:hypothetical protein
MSYYAHYYADGYQFYLAAEAFPAAIAAVRKAVQEEEDDYEWPFDLQRALPQISDEAAPRAVIERIFALCGWKATFNDVGDISEIQLPNSWKGAAEDEFDRVGLKPAARHAVSTAVVRRRWLEPFSPFPFPSSSPCVRILVQDTCTSPMEECCLAVPWSIVPRGKSSNVCWTRSASLEPEFF